MCIFKLISNLFKKNDDQYDTNQTGINNAIKEYESLNERMKNWIKKYQDLLKLDDLTIQEKEKLNERLKVYKEDTEILTKNYEEIMEKGHGIDPDQLSSFNSYYMKSTNDHFYYEIKSMDELKVRVIQERNNLQVDEADSPIAKSKKHTGLKRKETYKTQLSDPFVRRAWPKDLPKSKSKKGKKKAKSNKTVTA